jgi:hypothetical protein
MAIGQSPVVCSRGQIMPIRGTVTTHSMPGEAAQGNFGLHFVVTACTSW